MCTYYKDITLLTVYERIFKILIALLNLSLSPVAPKSTVAPRIVSHFEKYLSKREILHAKAKFYVGRLVTNHSANLLSGNIILLVSVFHIV